MGLLVDRLAETLERLRRLQSQLIHGGRATEAGRLQHDLVGRLEQVVLQIDGSSVDDRAERLEAAIEAAKVRFPRSRGGKGIRKKAGANPANSSGSAALSPSGLPTARANPSGLRPVPGKRESAEARRCVWWAWVLQSPGPSRSRAGRSSGARKPPRLRPRSEKPTPLTGCVLVLFDH